MSNSNNGSNNANANKGVSMKYLINDLCDESAKLAIGDSSLSRVSNDGELFSEFAGLGLSTDAVEWMISQEEQEKAQKPEVALAKAKASLKANNVEFDESMSDELILLLSEQFQDDTSNVSGYVNNKSEGVLVIVQQLSESGRWFTVKNNGVKATYWYDVETLFEREQGSISGLKTKMAMVSKIDYATKTVKKVPMQLPVVIADMQEMGYLVDGNLGRVLVKSSAFVRGTRIEGQLIEEVPAQFNHAFVNGEVVDQESNYVWDSIVDVYPGISILPSDSDTTQAKADTTAHDDNILIGMSVVTPAMSSYLMDASERDLQVALEEECRIITVKEKAKVLVKEEKRTAILDSAAGRSAQFIIDVADIDSAAALKEAADNIHMLQEILNAMYQIKLVTGKQANYAVYSKLQKMNKEAQSVKVKAAMTEVESHIVANIGMLNTGDIEVSDLNDAEAVEILETAAKFGRSMPSCFITNKSAYGLLSDRVKTIKFGEKAKLAASMFPKEVA